MTKEAKISVLLEISTTHSEIVEYLQHTEIWDHVNNDLLHVILSHENLFDEDFWRKHRDPTDYLDEVIDGYVWDYVAEHGEDFNN